MGGFVLRVVGVLPDVFGASGVDDVFTVLQDADSFGGVFYLEGAGGYKIVGELFDAR